jgi:hypothetical protein
MTDGGLAAVVDVACGYAPDVGVAAGRMEVRGSAAGSSSRAASHADPHSQLDHPGRFASRAERAFHDDFRP